MRHVACPENKSTYSIFYFIFKELYYHKNVWFRSYIIHVSYFSTQVVIFSIYAANFLEKNLVSVNWKQISRFPLKQKFDLNDFFSVPKYCDHAFFPKNQVFYFWQTGSWCVLCSYCEEFIFVPEVRSIMSYPGLIFKQPDGISN